MSKNPQSQMCWGQNFDLFGGTPPNLKCQAAVAAAHHRPDTATAAYLPLAAFMGLSDTYQNPLSSSPPSALPQTHFLLK